MRRMFEDITPEFIRKAERVGVDAKTVKIGLYRGADRIVWYFVKKKL